MSDHTTIECSNHVRITCAPHTLTIWPMSGSKALTAVFQPSEAKAIAECLYPDLSQLRAQLEQEREHHVLDCQALQWRNERDEAQAALAALQLRCADAAEELRGIIACTEPSFPTASLRKIVAVLAPDAGTGEVIERHLIDADGGRRVVLHNTASARPANAATETNMKQEIPTIEQRLKNVVIEQLGIDPQYATLEAHFIDDLGADSLDTVELVMAAEEEFEIEIPDEDAERLLTIKAAVHYVAERLATEGGAKP